MRPKFVIALVLLLALFPAFATGVAQDALRLALQALSSLLGGPNG